MESNDTSDPDSSSISILPKILLVLVAFTLVVLYSCVVFVIIKEKLYQKFTIFYMLLSQAIPDLYMLSISYFLSSILALVGPHYFFRNKVMIVISVGQDIMAMSQYLHHPFVALNRFATIYAGQFDWAASLATPKPTLLLVLCHWMLMLSLAIGYYFGLRHVLIYFDTLIMGWNTYFDQTDDEVNSMSIWWFAMQWGPMIPACLLYLAAYARLRWMKSQQSQPNQQANSAENRLLLVCLVNELMVLTSWFEWRYGWFYSGWNVYLMIDFTETCISSCNAITLILLVKKVRDGLRAVVCCKKNGNVVNPQGNVFVASKTLRSTVSK